MKYSNPVISGFYPDPSICKAGDSYYLVCSSFHYFPGVPLFESRDLINWTQIGYCLTRKSQLELTGEGASGGIYAPTIRYHEGRFYMVTTNIKMGNFYVWTEDIYGEWSEPVKVEQGGIDPSLYFEDGKAYFMSNGVSDDGIEGITQCEIDIETGRKLTASRSIWQGTGGRFLEGPHLYKMNNFYYLMAAEGGTEYGHMVIYARGSSPYGPFESYKKNPVLTNRDKGGYLIQGVGHGDLIEDKRGNWWMVHLAFRQISFWSMYHHLGREVYLVPVTFDREGWFSAGVNGMTPLSVETDRIPEGVIQEHRTEYTFHNMDWKKDWCMLRNPALENYTMGDGSLRLRGTAVTLEKTDSPTFIGIRQKEMKVQITCEVTVTEGEGGITILMDEFHHYDLALKKLESGGFLLQKRVCIGDIKYLQESFELEDKPALTAKLTISGDSSQYRFEAVVEGKDIFLGTNKTKYVSTEVAEGFTGVMIGLYAQGEGKACKEPVLFENFQCRYDRCTLE